MKPGIGWSTSSEPEHCPPNSRLDCQARNSRHAKHSWVVAFLPNDRDVWLNCLSLTSIPSLLWVRQWPNNVSQTFKPIVSVSRSANTIWFWTSIRSDADILILEANQWMRLPSTRLQCKCKESEKREKCIHEIPGSTDFESASIWVRRTLLPHTASCHGCRESPNFFRSETGIEPLPTSDTTALEKSMSAPS
jgi:hypothetical protein